MTNFKPIIEKYQAFYASARSGLMICPRVPCGITDFEPWPLLNQLDWSDPASFRKLARTKLTNARREWAATPADVRGDGIPCLANGLGTGAIAAAFVRDAVVRHESNTNYLDTPIPDWSAGVDRIGFDPDNPFYRAHMAGADFLAAEWDGTYAILPFPHFDPLDLCNQLRGNDVFFDFADHPAELHELLRRVTTAILKLEAHTRKHHLKGYEGPSFGMDCWCPGSYLSCDAGDLIAPDVLAEFGQPYTQQIVAAWSGAFLHHHELGARQIPVWAGCEGLTVQYITRDPNQRHLAQGGITGEIMAASLCVPVFFEATYAEFMAGVDDWRRGKFIIGVQCETAEQARAALTKGCHCKIEAT